MELIQLCTFWWVKHSTGPERGDPPGKRSVWVSAESWSRRVISPGALFTRRSHQEKVRDYFATKLLVDSTPFHFYRCWPQVCVVLLWLGSLRNERFYEGKDQSFYCGVVVGTSVSFGIRKMSEEPR